MIAALIKAKRLDLAKAYARHVTAAAVKWKDEGQDVHIGRVMLNLKDALGKPRKREVILRIDGREGTWRVDYLGTMGNIWEAIDGGKGLATLPQAKKYAAQWVKRSEIEGELRLGGLGR